MLCGFYDQYGERERRGVSDQEILERCLYSMINEGAKILSEKIAARASDIDVVWVNAFEAAGNDDIKPAPLLERLAAEGGRFLVAD